MEINEFLENKEFEETFTDEEFFRSDLYHAYEDMVLADTFAYQDDVGTPTGCPLWCTMKVHHESAVCTAP